jgi:hypothetical protein
MNVGEAVVDQFKALSRNLPIFAEETAIFHNMICQDAVELRKTSAPAGY